MSTSAAVLKAVAEPQAERGSRTVDFTMLAGIGIAIAAIVCGIVATGVRLTYFLQPAGVLIVVGGTAGVMILTTPRMALFHALQRVRDLLWARDVDREALIADIMSFVKPARQGGVLAIESRVDRAQHPFLKECLMLALDVQSRAELQSAMEMKVRLRERQGEADAKVLEVAGGFAPTIGVLGTVVGLIDVLRQFSNLSSVAGGIGTAFVSTIYGLALANMVLLPAAHRIHARVAETFETNELIIEGVLCMYDRIHPALVRERLNAFLREVPAQ